MIEIKINVLRGIPPGIRTGKRRVGKVNNPSETKFRKSAIKTNILEKLLYEGKQHYIKVIELLKVFPENIEEYKLEYQALLEKEIYLKNIINQLKNQLQVREEKKKNRF